MENSKPTHRKHNPWHDYSKRCIYHITIVVRDRAEILGRLTEVVEGDSTTICPWDADAKAWMNLTPLGMDVAECIHNIPAYGKKKGLKLRILAQQVMDTHLHFCLFVEKDMESVVLGDLIKGFKTGCNKAYRKRLESGTMCLPDRTGTLDGSRARGTGLFEEDYDETILTRHGQLQRMIDYVHQNPYRKWVKVNNTGSFIPVRGIMIAGRRYDAIGNLMLLGLKRFQDHTRYKWELAHDTEAIRNHQNECVKKARLNYAIVSPFVNEAEWRVRDFCLQEGHSIIQLCDNGFTDYTTCPGNLFEYCETGQVLLLVPSDWPHVEKKGRCTRQECNMLNGYAEEIVNERA